MRDAGWCRVCGYNSATKQRECPSHQNTRTADDVRARMLSAVLLSSASCSECTGCFAEEGCADVKVGGGSGAENVAGCVVPDDAALGGGNPRSLCGKGILGWR